MSTLVAFNLTATPITLAAGNPPPQIPASSNPPARGTGVNVTSELEGLTEAEYLLIQNQIAAKQIEIEWDGYPNYRIAPAVVSNPYTGASAAFLESSTGQISIAGAAAPQPGQALVALNGEEAEWQATPQQALLESTTLEAGFASTENQRAMTRIHEVSLEISRTNQSILSLSNRLSQLEARIQSELNRLKEEIYLK